MYINKKISLIVHTHCNPTRLKLVRCYHDFSWRSVVIWLWESKAVLTFVAMYLPSSHPSRHLIILLISWKNIFRFTWIWLIFNIKLTNISNICTRLHVMLINFSQFIFVKISPLSINSAGYYQHPEVVQFTRVPSDAVVCGGCRLEMNCSILKQNTTADLPQPELEWIFNGRRIVS